MEKLNLGNEALEFLLYSYFEITAYELSKCDENALMEVCARKAYLDLCRTLSFKDKDASHAAFRDGMCKIVVEEANSLLKSNVGEFDKHHGCCCEIICCKASETEELQKGTFHPGHAQKWLNMTLKYMWLLGMRKDEFEKLLSVLHVPVDSYIIQAVWEKDKEKVVPIPLCTNKKRIGKYSDEKVVSWSRWNGEDYMKFQEHLRKLLNGRKPIEWESTAWIEIAKKRAAK